MQPYIFIATFPTAPTNYGRALLGLKKLLPGHTVLGSWEGVGYFAGFVADHPPTDLEVKAALADDRIFFMVLPLEVGAQCVVGHGGDTHNWIRRHLSPLPRRS